MSLQMDVPALSFRQKMSLRWKKRPGIVICLCLGWLLAIIFVAIFADLIAPYSYSEQSLLKRLQPPAFLGGDPAYILGTDALGRDVFSRLLYATRMSIIIALLGSLIGATVGTLIGFIAAHFRGWVEDAIMVLVDFQASMPFLVIVLAVLAFFGNSFGLFLVIVGLHGWDTYARVTRGLVLQANGQSYAFAIRTLGIHPVQVYLRHILPNILSILIVQITLSFPDIILLETALSFLGLGIQPPNTSLGLALGEGRTYLATAWWIGVPAGFVIFFTTLSISLAGDWLRDKLDPTLKTADH